MQLIGESKRMRFALMHKYSHAKILKANFKSNHIFEMKHFNRIIVSQSNNVKSLNSKQFD